jgi:hypothetical protein
MRAATVQYRCHGERMNAESQSTHSDHRLTAEAGGHPEFFIRGGLGEGMDLP